jgi:Flp pilus assembly protein TadG
VRFRERGQAGAAAVEFAFIAPLLIMLVFGIISFGILFAQTLALSNGAREAARFGVVESRTCGQITAEAKDVAQSIAMDDADVSVTIRRGASDALATSPCTDGAVQPCAGSADGDSLYVDLSFDGTLVIPLVVAEPTFPLSGNGAFRCEYS